MRLHRKPNAPRLRQRFRHQSQGFESGCWSHLPSPVKDGTGWVLFVKTTVSAAAVFQAMSLDSLADFFVAIDLADLGMIPENQFLRNDLG